MKKKSNQEKTISKKVIYQLIKLFLIIVIIIFSALYIPGMLYADLTIICIFAWCLLLGVVIVNYFLLVSLIRGIREIINLIKE